MQEKEILNKFLLLANFIYLWCMRIVQLCSGILIILRIYYNYWQQRRREERQDKRMRRRWGGDWHWGLWRGQCVINMKSADICHFAYCILPYAAFCGAFCLRSWYNCLQHVRQRVAMRSSLMLCVTGNNKYNNNKFSLPLWQAKNQINCVPKAQLSADQSSGRA